MTEHEPSPDQPENLKSPAPPASAEVGETAGAEFEQELAKIHELKRRILIALVGEDQYHAEEATLGDSAEAKFNALAQGDFTAVMEGADEEPGQFALEDAELLQRKFEARTLDHYNLPAGSNNVVHTAGTEAGLDEAGRRNYRYTEYRVDGGQLMGQDRVSAHGQPTAAEPQPVPAMDAALITAKLAAYREQLEALAAATPDEIRARLQPPPSPEAASTDNAPA
ncbi:MAG TPA: hypothetical protein VMT30_04195 [Candidatus Saccharimonadia bacterium]|nr:hypothetical protein [Candidatus Saccharimonadia bacterium]